MSNDDVYPGQQVQIINGDPTHQAWKGLFGVVVGEKLHNTPYYPVEITVGRTNPVRKNVLLERSDFHVC